MNMKFNGYKEIIFIIFHELYNNQQFLKLNEHTSNSASSIIPESYMEYIVD